MTNSISFHVEAPIPGEGFYDWGSNPKLIAKDLDKMTKRYPGLSYTTEDSVLEDDYPTILFKIYGVDGHPKKRSIIRFLQNKEYIN